MGFIGIREFVEKVIFYGNGFLLYYVVVISGEVIYLFICEEMESLCNSSYTLYVLYVY